MERESSTFKHTTQNRKLIQLAFYDDQTVEERAIQDTRYYGVNNVPLLVVKTVVMHTEVLTYIYVCHCVHTHTLQCFGQLQHLEWIIVPHCSALAPTAE